MRLGDVITVNPESIGKGYPFEEIEYIDISSVDSGALQCTQRLQVSNAPSRAKRIVRNGDTLLATVRPNLKSFLFARNPSENTIASTGFAVLRAGEEIDARFLYFTVTNQPFTDYLTANAKGSAYPAVDTSTIERAEIFLPPLPTQRKIAAILSAYDDLIENTRRRIKVLEEMAQRIYREWFVHFRYPGHENVPLTDSPLGPLPKGWVILKVVDVIGKIKRKVKVKKSSYSERGSFPIIDQGRDFIGGYTDNLEGIYEDPLPMIIFGDHTRILKLIDFPFACGADGTQLIYPKEDLATPLFFYHVLKEIDLSNYAYARHFKFLKEQEIVIPNRKLVGQFEEISSTLYKLRNVLMNQNGNLKQTRDLLLPKLISGEIDVAEAPMPKEDAA